MGIWTKLLDYEPVGEGHNTQELGGKSQGRVRDGHFVSTAKVALTVPDPPGAAAEPLNGPRVGVNLGEQLVSAPSQATHDQEPVAGPETGREPVTRCGLETGRRYSSGGPT